MDPTQPNAWPGDANEQPADAGDRGGQPYPQVPPYGPPTQQRYQQASPYGPSAQQQPYQQAPASYPPPYYAQGQTQYPGYPQDQQPYGYYPQGYGQGWNPQPDPGNGLSIAAIVLGVISVLFLPILFGPIGLILAGIAKSKRQSLSTIALWVSGGGMVVGFIIGALVVTAMY